MVVEPAPPETLSPDTANQWPPQRRRTWFAILGAPAAWFAHLSAGWYVSGNACLRGDASWGPLSEGQVWLVQGGIALVCIGTAAAALMVALLDWRASDNRRITEIHATARPDYLAAIALLVSTSFLLATVYDGIAQLMLPLCERIR